MSLLSLKRWLVVNSWFIQPQLLDKRLYLTRKLAFVYRIAFVTVAVRFFRAYEMKQGDSVCVMPAMDVNDEEFRKREVLERNK